MNRIRKPFIILPIVFILILLSFAFFTRNRCANLRPFYVDILERFVAFGSDDLKTLSGVLRYLGALYVNESRLDPKKMWMASAEQLQKRVADLIVKKEKENNVKIIVNGNSRNFNLSKISNLDDLFENSKDLFTHIVKNSKEKIELPEIKNTLIEGLLTPLDPHTVYMPPDIFREMEIDTVGEFGGLGINISIKDGFLTVISPIEDTPAFRAGLKSRDRIMVIDGESTINMSLIDAVKKMRGPKNTMVELGISRRDNPELLAFKIKREIINIRSVKSKLLDNDIGYLKIKIFQNDTSGEVKSAVKKMDENGRLKGLILDLRNNPGGPLDQAIEVSDFFVDEGTIVSTVAKDNNELNAKKATVGGLRSDCPLIVLISEGSASASEIVAGAIKYLGRGIVVGATSFGKGSVQQVERFSDKSALKLTVAQYLAGGTKSIHGIGIVPDILLDPVYIDKDEIDLFYNKRDSEDDKEALFDKKFASSKPSKPFYTLKYLYKNGVDKKVHNNTKEKESDGENEENEEDITYYQATDVIDITKDHFLGFATRLFAHLGKINGGEISLSELEPYIKSEKEKNDKEINSALVAVGVDWSTSNENNNKIEIEIEQFDKKYNATAGDDVSLSLSLKNKSNLPVFRCFAVTKSKSPILNDREFIVGHVKPNESVKRVIKLKIPEKSVTGARRFSLSFSSECGKVVGNTNSEVYIKSKERPILAFAYKTLSVAESSNKADISKTDKSESEKKIKIVLNVKNSGIGDSMDTVAVIKNVNGKGIFIDNGRVTLGKIKKDEIKGGEFAFKVLKDYTKDKIDFVLTIADLELDYFLSKNISISLNKNQEVKDVGESAYYSPPLFQKIDNKCLLGQYENKCAIEGSAVSENGLKDVMVFVGENKTTYIRASKGGSSTNLLDFKEEIELKSEDDVNVLLIARDQNDVSSSYSFYIAK